MVAGHIISQHLYTMSYMYSVRPTMTIIATTSLNLPFANQIMDAFNEYSNECEFTAEGGISVFAGPNLTPYLN
jgi:hypothetical protein